MNKQWEDLINIIIEEYEYDVDYDFKTNQIELRHRWYKQSEKYDVTQANYEMLNERFFGKTKTIKVVEWFGGLGAASMALKRVYDNVIICDYVELDKNATKAFNVINNTNYQPTDINDVDVTTQKYEDVDLLVAGWPCQDFSQAGKAKGLKGNRSNLILTTIEKLKEMKELDRLPKYILLENVKGLVSKTHINDFKDIMELFDELGYNYSYDVLNSKDFGVAQSRERVFIILTRKDLDSIDISQLKKVNVHKAIKDIMENDQNNELYHSKIKLDGSKYYYIKNELPQYNGRDIKIDIDLLMNKDDGKLRIKTVGLLGTVNEGKDFEIVSYNSNKHFLGVDGLAKTLRAGDSYFQNKIIFTRIPYKSDSMFLGVDGLSTTITTANPHVKNKIIWEQEDNNYVNVYYRNLTLLELWRLMGFDEKHFNELKSMFSKSALSKMIGNSIVVNILEEIFRQLF